MASRIMQNQENMCEYLFLQVLSGNLYKKISTKSYPIKKMKCISTKLVNKLNVLV